jgi:hypothetical protein
MQNNCPRLAQSGRAQRTIARRRDGVLGGPFVCVFLSLCEDDFSDRLQEVRKKPASGKLKY